MGIRIVNNTPFNHAVRVGNRTYPIPRFTIWTCPIGHESAIDYRTVRGTRLQVVEVSDEEAKAALDADALKKAGGAAPAAETVEEAPPTLPEKDLHEPEPAEKGKAAKSAKAKDAEADWPAKK